MLESLWHLKQRGPVIGCIHWPHDTLGMERRARNPNEPKNRPRGFPQAQSGYYLAMGYKCIHLNGMFGSYYDPNALTAKAKAWRAEVAVTPLDAMRAFCLSEAERCDRIVEQSLHTPVFHESTKT